MKVVQVCLGEYLSVRRRQWPFWFLDLSECGDCGIGYAVLFVDSAEAKPGR